MSDSRRMIPSSASAGNQGGGAHPAPEDLALFAMQLLAPEQANAIEQHVPLCPACREELGRIHGDLAAVALTAEAATPAPAARARLLAQIAREKKFVAAPAAQTAPTAQPQMQPAARIQSEAREQLLSQPDPARPLARFGRNKAPAPTVESAIIALRQLPVSIWAGWTAAAVFVVTSGLLYWNQGRLADNLARKTGEVERLNALAQNSHRLVDSLTDPQAVRVMLAPKALPHGPVAGVTYNPKKGTLVLLASNLDPLRSYKTYELWVIPADGSASIPAGTFHPDEHGNASVILPNLSRNVKARAFGITIEDAGGSDKPTLPIIMAGS
jgi:hypothetical protein